MFALPGTIVTALHIFVDDEFKYESYYLLILYTAIILQYLGFLIGLILNIFAIPIALFFGPILGGVAIWDELRWRFRQDEQLDDRSNENRQRAQEFLDDLLRRKD
jgi:hypothetical protein